MENNDNEFTCCHCNRVFFNSLNDFRDHNSYAHAGQYVECNLCRNVFFRGDDLQTHKRQHHQPPPPPPPPAPVPPPQQQEEAAQPQAGEVMAALSARGAAVVDSEEAEALACRKAIEFATDAGFSELIVEGDNAMVMRAVSSTSLNWSLGVIYDDTCCLAAGLCQCLLVVFGVVSILWPIP